MSSFSIIQQKLEQFIKKYYTNELIKGILLFLSFGLLYFLCTLLIEHFLWLSTKGRTFLFWSFIAVEALLFFRFIAFPLAKLFNLQQGISYEEASKIIGSHFKKEVNDKLLNVIQLNQNQRASELLIASINQKAEALSPLPFVSAIQFSKNLKYAKYLALPVLLFVVIHFFWDRNIFSNSYKRVVDYETAYEPPAPFQFSILNNDLKAIENKNFTIQIQTLGKVVPENATISFNEETYFLEQISPGKFQFTFTQPKEDFTFLLKGNKVTSIPYQVKVIKTPSLTNFEMELVYPSYLGKPKETLKSTGNATLPEGTQITWKINALNTQQVHFIIDTLKTPFKQENATTFQHKKQIFNKLSYTINTSNNDLQDYESLHYNINVIKDEFPSIFVTQKKDTTAIETYYFLGDISDDYGLTKLQLVYYPIGEESQKNTKNIAIEKTNFHQFTFTFPGDLPLQEGVAYEYYFEVFDNDALHNYKKTKSNFFTFKKLTQDEIENEQLKNQEETINKASKTLKDLKEQEKLLNEINKTQKEKNELNWNDKKKLNEFLKKQKQQEELMKQFSKEMKENLEKFEPNKEDPYKEQLKERLENNEKQLEENQKLLEELERLQEKIDKEELNEKLDKLSKQNQNQEKNLEQLVELTKRYYVAKKAEKVAEQLFKLGEEQEALSKREKQENTPEKQEDLNKKFEDLQKEMQDLQKENKELKEPMDIPNDSKTEEEIKQEQQKATDNLKNNKSQDAQQNQKKAGEQLKKMGSQMQSQMMAGQMETMEEDAQMLRQILDNLVVFSFQQEDLLEDFKIIDYGSAAFGKKLTKQNDLKTNFQHIDDSLFAISLRQPMISEKINEAITNVSYNIDKSLEQLAENNFRTGLSSQQYTITGANDLAILLSDALGFMQQMAMSMPGQGQGQGKGKGQGQGFQLPDIIKKQESLSQQMKDGMQKGQQGKEGHQEGEGKEGNQGKGSDGKDGNQQGEGQGGKEGQGNKQGKLGNNGFQEDLNGQLYEIYKQQQDLRNQLQDRLSKQGLDGKGGKLIKEMEGIEQQLLDKGFNQRTLERMLNLQYELLKLDEADFKQGQDNKRESTTNRNTFNNTLRMTPEDIKKYFNQQEILNREPLPLKQKYRKEIQNYFNTND